MPNGHEFFCYLAFFSFNGNNFEIILQANYWAPPNLKKLLSTKLKHMTLNGKLIKVIISIAQELL